MLDPQQDMYEYYGLEITKRIDGETESIFEIKVSELHFFNNLPDLTREYLLREITKDYIIHHQEFINWLWHIYNLTLIKKGNTKHDYYDFIKNIWVEKNKNYAIYQFTISKQLTLLVPNWQPNTIWHTNNGVYEDDEQ